MRGKSGQDQAKLARGQSVKVLHVNRWIPATVVEDRGVRSAEGFLLLRVQPDQTVGLPAFEVFENRIKPSLSKKQRASA